MVDIDAAVFLLASMFVFAGSGGEVMSLDVARPRQGETVVNVLGLASMVVWAEQPMALKVGLRRTPGIVTVAEEVS